MTADEVITDRLAPVGLLSRLGRHVEIIDASRMPGQPTLTYDQVTELMIDRTLAGRTVVRLKGGDPFVFAHGSQEVRPPGAANPRPRSALAEPPLVPAMMAPQGAPGGLTWCLQPRGGTAAPWPRCGNGRAAAVLCVVLSALRHDSP